MALSIDDKVLIVSYSPPALNNDSPDPTKAISLTGQYTRDTPVCFRKEGGGEIYHDEGYWYIKDRLNQQAAFVAAEFVRPVVVPRTGWQSKGDGFFSSYEDLPITVEFRQLATAPKAGETGCCFEAAAPVYQAMKDKLPHQHRQSLEGIEAKALERKESFKATASDKLEEAKGLHAQHWPGIKEQALKHSETAKGKFDEYHPVVKQKAKEGYTACYDWWTHPDTVDKMKKGGDGCVGLVKCCAAACWDVTANLAESICGIQQQAPRPNLPVSESDQAMDASYVKLDSTTPVLVEPPMLPPVPLPPGTDALMVNSALLANPSLEPTTLPPNRGDTGTL